MPHPFYVSLIVQDEAGTPRVFSVGTYAAVGDAAPHPRGCSQHFTHLTALRGREDWEFPQEFAQFLCYSSHRSHEG